MTYNNNHYSNKGSKLRKALILFVIILLAAFAGAVATRFWYENQLKPVSSVTQIVTVEIPTGSSVQEIATLLDEKGVIRSSQAFEFYIRNNSLNESLKAGTYDLDTSKTTPEIISIITKGDVKETLFTILPGQRLDQIKSALIKFGFDESEVNSALNANNYQGHPALVAKPSNLNLEGYLYPESFKTNSTTTVKEIITKSLDEMAEAVTPDLIQAWQNQGLGIHQAISLASIVENEVSDPTDRAIVAGVFYNRLANGMMLESDPTYRFVGGRNVDSPYNTYLYPGIPPGPISNVSNSSLQAVANPKSHDYLFFVAGDDGITRFSKTLAEHQENTAKYCVELCKSY